MFTSTGRMVLPPFPAGTHLPGQVKTSRRTWAVRSGDALLCGGLQHAAWCLQPHPVQKARISVWEMGCYMEPLSCKPLGHLVVPRHLGWAPFCWCTLFRGGIAAWLPQGVPASGMERCWASSPRGWYPSELTVVCKGRPVSRAVKHSNPHHREV